MGCGLGFWKSAASSSKKHIGAVASSRLEPVQVRLQEQKDGCKDLRNKRVDEKIYIVVVEQ